MTLQNLREIVGLAEGLEGKTPVYLVGVSSDPWVSIEEWSVGYDSAICQYVIELKTNLEDADLWPTNPRGAYLTGAELEDENEQ